VRSKVQYRVQRIAKICSSQSHDEDSRHSTASHDAVPSLLGYYLGGWEARKRRKSKSKDAWRCLVRSGLDENSEIRVPRFRVPEADEHFRLDEEDRDTNSYSSGAG